MANGKCRMHGGGSSPKGNQGNRNAVKHGAYVKAVLTAEELARLPDLKLRLGSVDDELTLLRLQLDRVSNAQRRSDEIPGRRVPDYTDLILRLTARIGALELARKAIAPAGSDGASPMELAMRVQQAIKQIRAMEGYAEEPIGPGFVDRPPKNAPEDDTP